MSDNRYTSRSCHPPPTRTSTFFSPFCALAPTRSTNLHMTAFLESATAARVGCPNEYLAWKSSTCAARARVKCGSTLRISSSTGSELPIAPTATSSGSCAFETYSVAAAAASIEPGRGVTGRSSPYEPMTEGGRALNRREGVASGVATVRDSRRYDDGTRGTGGGCDADAGAALLRGPPAIRCACAIKLGSGVAPPRR